MNAKQLKTLISELVRREIEQHKEEIIKEVRTELKSELFDLLVSGKVNGQPVNESATAAPVAETKTDSDIDRTSLRQLFERHITGDASTVSSAPSPVPVPSTEIPAQLPSTFTGRDETGTPAKSDDVQRTMTVINRDYSALMKAMEKKN